MPSQLRYSTSSSAIPTSTTKSYSSVQSPQKKQKMSLTQTYYLAHTARAKLSREAARADHDLRLLVGHANLLDGLMVDLAEAEREQESWFNQSVKGATKESEELKHIQWATSVPTVVEDYEEEEDSSDDESETSDDDEEMSYTADPLRPVPSPPTMITTTEMDIDSDADEDDEDLLLTRSSSRSPPELLHESDSESDDDSMPPSPQHTLDAYSEQQRQLAYFAQSKAQPASLSIPASQEADFYEEGYYLPQRQAVGSVY
ncbi:hypothetical protein MMC13_001215 [Lambiella insularis]|nr:hypothetical protein [Lambiella insularis]